jgi:hypothetical protein
MLMNLQYALSLLVIATALPALAQEEAAYKADSMCVGGAPCATVSRMGVHLFGIPVGAGGMTMDQRAQLIADERLNLLLGKGVLSVPGALRVGTMGREVVIYVENPDNVGLLGTRTLLLTIDANYERYLGAGRWDIAFFWRDMMKLWSSVGIMKYCGEPRDPAGRTLDAAHTWHRVPKGYASRYGH